MVVPRIRRMKKSEREFVERIFGMKKFGYFFVFLGIWFVLDAIRTSGSEVWTDPGFWVGFLMVLVWSRILVVVQKKKSINQPASSDVGPSGWAKETYTGGVKP